MRSFSVVTLLRLIVVKSCFTHLMLVLVGSFSYTPGASFSLDLLMHSCGWFSLMRNFSYWLTGRKRPGY